jgi:hypothetical protein
MKEACLVHLEELDKVADSLDSGALLLTAPCLGATTVLIGGWT